MKKAFSTLITIFLITIFSFLSIFILETNSISNDNNQKFYYISQAKLHLNFFKEYLKSYDFNKNRPNVITLNINDYKLKAIIIYEEEKAIVNYEVSLKDKNINFKENLEIVL